MAQALSNLEVLSSRAGFNAAVRHINNTIHIADAIKNRNMGDLLFEDDPEVLSGEAIALLLRMLLVDKLGYQARSSNLVSAVADPAALAEEFARWSAVDLLAVYHHPELGLLAANPKDPAQLTAWGGLKRWELLVVYAGGAGNGTDELCRKAAGIALDLFEGTKTKITPELYRGEFTVKKPKKAAPIGSVKGERKRNKIPPGTARKKSVPPAVPAANQAERPVFTMDPVVKGPIRMTPRYSVVVRNELFHNGNVEAWKRIIASYNTKYPELQVYIYYDGERIQDINALFKWGKVKHGSSIQFSVAGADIKDVAKLQRYLLQGASPQFEAFLRGSVTTVLKLF
ncbi:MAG: hypothetical protein LBP71_01340 [Spirochaetaceae bacterium]|jgi:hypothetical protein|nr:hypothetical protein [Spirochaetaceae bacterium]